MIKTMQHLAHFLASSDIRIEDVRVSIFVNDPESLKKLESAMQREFEANLNSFAHPYGVSPRDKTMRDYQIAGVTFRLALKGRVI